MDVAPANYSALPYDTKAVGGVVVHKSTAARANPVQIPVEIAAHIISDVFLGETFAASERFSSDAALLLSQEFCF